MRRGSTRSALTLRGALVVAQEHCAAECFGFHSTWELLRRCGLRSHPGWHTAFHADALTRAELPAARRIRVLLLGAADEAMLAVIAGVLGAARVDAHMVGACATPLRLAGAYAARHGIALTVHQGDVEGLPTWPQPFDLVVIDGLLPLLPTAADGDVLLSRLAGALGPGCPLLYTGRVAGPAGAVEYDRLGRLLRAAALRWAWPGATAQRRTVAADLRRASRATPVLDSDTLLTQFERHFGRVEATADHSPPSLALRLHPWTRAGARRRESPGLRLDACGDVMITPHITVEPYEPHPALDAALADLGYAAVRGWPDQRPIAASLVRSELRRFVGAPATVVAVHRDRVGQVVGAAALRRAASSSGTSRFWGPIVHPALEGQRIGRALLAALDEVIAAEHTPVLTVGIPAGRRRARGFFTDAGWQATPRAELFTRSLPVPTGPGTGTVRAAGPGEDLHAAVADLLTAAPFGRPDGPLSTAFARWAADERFTPECLALAEADGRLNGAALAYPLQHPVSDEPAEAFLAELHLRPAAPAGLRDQLVALALNAAARHGATVARAVVAAGDVRTRECLERSGFSQLDVLCHYRARPVRTRP